jgi:hypothetical protein
LAENIINENEEDECRAKKEPDNVDAIIRDDDNHVDAQSQYAGSRKRRKKLSAK